MTNSKKEAYAKLSEAVEQLEEIGLFIEDASVEDHAEMPNMDLSSLLSGKTPDVETHPAIKIVATIDDDAPKQEHSGPDMDEDEAVDIGINTDVGSDGV